MLLIFYWFYNFSYVRCSWYVFFLCFSISHIFSCAPHSACNVVKATTRQRCFDVERRKCNVVATTLKRWCVGWDQLITILLCRRSCKCAHNRQLYPGRTRCPAHTSPTSGRPHNGRICLLQLRRQPISSRCRNKHNFLPWIRPLKMCPCRALPRPSTRT